jgi:hypothetical protein
MSFTSVSADGITRGNLTDAERMRAQQGQTQSAIDAQMRALQAEIADRQAGRAFQGTENERGRAFQGDMFNANADLTRGLDQSATERAFGSIDRQMGPANSDAAIRKAEWDAGANKRALQDSVFKQIMPAIAGGGQPGEAPGGKFAMDPDAMMFMAMGGNPGEYMQQKRQQSNADRQHTDAEDARNTEIGTRLIASGKPEAVALGTHFLSLVKNSGFAGQDPALLKSALQPQIAPGEALAKNIALSQQFDELASMATDTSKSFDTAGNLATIKTRVAGLIKALTDKGVTAEDAAAYVKGELGKRVPKETGLRLGALFPSISSVGQTRAAIGLDN